jgi:hypothetical protein
MKYLLLIYHNPGTLQRGGHVIAGEAPELLAESIRSYFRDLR